MLNVNAVGNSIVTTKQCGNIVDCMDFACVCAADYFTNGEYFMVEFVVLLFCCVFDAIRTN